MFLARIGNYSEDHSLHYYILTMQSGISLSQGGMGKPHKRLEKDTKGWYKDKKTNCEILNSYTSMSCKRIWTEATLSPTCNPPQGHWQIEWGLSS